jgi:hypothetical protein
MFPTLNHFAVNADDVDASASFYGAVFGWQFREYGPPGFLQILDESGQAPIGAIQQRRQLAVGGPTRGFECTFGVDDVDAIRERVVEAGGRILMERVTIPGVGDLLAFEDPSGHPVLAMQYESPAPGEVGS